MNRKTHLTHNEDIIYVEVIEVKYRAHLTGAILSGCGIIYLCNQIGISTNPFNIICGAAIGGLIPDIDHPDSFLGYAIQPISTFLLETVGHRTFTHSLLFSLLISIVGAMFHIMLGIGIGIGMLSHILLDLLTPNSNGVAFLYPFCKRKIKLL